MSKSFHLLRIICRSERYSYFIPVSKRRFELNVHKVAMKTFVDNICRYVIKRYIFSPYRAGFYSS